MFMLTLEDHRPNLVLQAGVEVGLKVVWPDSEGPAQPCISHWLSGLQYQ